MRRQQGGTQGAQNPQTLSGATSFAILQDLNLQSIVSHPLWFPLCSLWSFTSLSCKSRRGGGEARMYGSIMRVMVNPVHPSSVRSHEVPMESLQHLGDNSDLSLCWATLTPDTQAGFNRWRRISGDAFRSTHLNVTKPWPSRKKLAFALRSISHHHTTIVANTPPQDGHTTPWISSTTPTQAA